MDTKNGVLKDQSQEPHMATHQSKGGRREMKEGLERAVQPFFSSPGMSALCMDVQRLESGKAALSSKCFAFLIR